MHYALVSDLLTKEEFDERVENKCEELGGAVDEICAAMLVVEELGRSHIKIGEIKTTSTALVCFFGKILEITEPREFTREGEEGTEPGLVASVLLGDPTGTVKMTLWDAKAAAVAELETGSVLEVIAKPRPGYRNEVVCAALRPSQVTIVETKKPPKSETMKVPLVAKILVIGEPREISRRDGTTSVLQEILVGDPSGTARIITWEPEIFAELDEGISVSFAGLIRKEDEDSVEYIAGDATVITPHPEEISVLTVDAGDVTEGQTSIVTGVVLSVSPVRTFTTRRGTESRVKNIRLGSETRSGAVNIAAWNEDADITVLPGDHLEVINAQARLNRYGETELSVGRGTMMRFRTENGADAEICGLLIPRPEGMTVDDGRNPLIVTTDEVMIPGMRVTLTGWACSSRITPSRIEPASLPLDELRNRLSVL